MLKRILSSILVLATVVSISMGVVSAKDIEKAEDTFWCSDPAMLYTDSVAEKQFPWTDSGRRS